MLRTRPAPATARRWVAWALAAAPIAVAVAWLPLRAVGPTAPRDTMALIALSVVEVVPHEVELGDRVAILGAGFPVGQPARVTFRGTLHRPGERPERGAEIVATARSVAPQRIELPFEQGTQELFCGAGDRAIHTTFEGQIEVAFEAAAPSAAAVAGRIEHVVLDVRPSERGSSLADREREGERALAWIGLRSSPSGSGLIVAGVAPGSAAETAGLLPGDVMTTFDGVRVRSAADAVPAPGARMVTLGVSAHGNQDFGHEAERLVPMAGFYRSPRLERAAAALLVFAALFVVWLCGAPAGPTAAAWLDLLGSKVRERMGTARGALAVPQPGMFRYRAQAKPQPTLYAPISASAAWKGFVAVAMEAMPQAGVGALADVVPCALLAAMPFEQYLVSADLDVGFLFVAAGALLAAATCALRPTFWRGALAGAIVVSRHIPAAAAIASIVVTTGSLRVREIARAQGGWPWDWLALRSPAALVAFGLLLSSMWIAPPARPRTKACLPSSAAAGFGARASDEPWLEAARRTHRGLIAGLASVLFLGAWRLPGLDAEEQSSSLALEAAGVAWLWAKTWALVVLTGWGSALAFVDLRRAPKAAARYRLTAVSMAVLGASAAWTWWGPSANAQRFVSVSLFAAVGLGAVAGALGLRRGMASRVPESHLSTFL